MKSCFFRDWFTIAGIWHCLELEFNKDGHVCSRWVDGKVSND